MTPSLAPLSQEPLTKTDAQLVAEGLRSGHPAGSTALPTTSMPCPAGLIEARLPLLRKPFGPAIVSFA